MITNHIAIVASYWLFYFALHSLTASLGLKGWVAARYPQWMPYYRLGFNLLSTLLLLPVLWMSLRWQQPLLWQWQGVIGWLMHGATIAAIIGFWFSLRDYDSAELLGLRQIREGIRSVEDQERFHIGEFHRYVRHPWYFLALVLIWSRAMDPIMLTSAVMLSLYFIFGSRLEERKLIQYHGPIYRAYQRRVAGLMPLPWRILSRSQAAALLQQYGDKQR